MTIKKAVFEKSASASSDFLSGFPEYAFVGRSNVGKSSLLNYLVNSKSLAKVSGTPGRTRLVNYFLVDDAFRFVDLPGYGFSKAGKRNEAVWSTLIDDYLKCSKDLDMVFLLVDVRLDVSPLDKIMTKWLYANNIPFKVIATKFDKIPRSQTLQKKDMIASGLSIGRDDIILSSSDSKIGKEEILKIIEERIETK